MQMNKVSVLIGSCLFLSACAGAGRLNTPTGKPFIGMRQVNWKQASVAIADYNFSKGRQLDVVKPNEIVLYDAVPGADGKEEVTSKTVYTLATNQDSLLISSHRYQTDDLEDNSPSELDDQASLDAQQQELTEILNVIARSMTASNQNLAQPQQSQ